MRNILKKPVPLFIAKILLGLVLILGAYYLFVLRPSLAIPQKLFEVRKILVEAQYNALQNRIAYTGLARLNPASGRFTYARERHIANITGSQETAIGFTQSPPKLPKTEGLVREFTDFTNKLSEKLPGLYQDEVTILEKQKKILERVSRYYQIIEKIYLYRTSRDIGRLDFSREEDRKTATTRAEAAVTGLEKISEELTSLDFEKEKVSSLRKDISATQAVFRRLAASPQKVTYEAARDKFNELRTKAYELEKELLFSEEGIDFLTEQTNWILEFNYLLEELQDMEKKVLPDNQ